ncbi:MAG: efflux RND transporter permease subunit [Spirochaetaceae bacterium]|jgi:HAE1 family hydrophobic/amphiphilic exporter-1|nr:efflux RND transporter permease subunit [Spirochaetaceae bacterium]
MSISKTVVNRPTTVLIIFLLLIGLGFFALANLPIDLFPEINPPYLVVNTTYAGAGPEEVERTVTRVLEAALASVSGLEKVTSTSSKGASMVIMQFTYGTDLIDASNSVRDALERTRRILPADADTPLIFRFDPSMIPIMGLMVTSDTRSPDELRQLTEDTIVPRLEQINGVATASVSGGRNKIIRVEIPESRLEAYNLTVTGIQGLIAAQNAQVAAGTITEGGLSYILTTMGEYDSLDDIRNTVIAYKGGGVVNGQYMQPVPVKLRDIANVFEGYKDETSSVFIDNQRAVQMTVQKQSGKNSVQVANDVRARIPRIAKEVPPDVQISELYNTTDQIEKSISQVTQAAVSGAALAVLILFLFLRSVKPTLIIGISIPVSIVVTLMLMYFAGLTLNLMTLAGLVLGIGMLVDNSIVILENIYHYREKGAKLIPAAILGSHEMLTAIFASTLTTVCVFAPLVLFQSMLEMAGEMFAGLAFTVVISLGISLFTAIFLVPVLASHYLPLVTRKQKPLRGLAGGLDKGFEGFFTGLDNAYRKAVSWVLRHKVFVLLVILLLFGGSIYLVPKIGWQFMPEQDQDSVVINITMPLGTPLEETSQVLSQLQDIVEAEARGYTTLVRTAGGGGGFMSTPQSNTGSLRINLPVYAKRVDDASTIKTKLQKHFNLFPGAVFSFGGGGGFGGSSSPVDIVLRTDDLVKGKAIADQIAALLREKLPEVTDPQVDLQDGLPQYEILLDRERMYALGLNAMTVGSELKAAVDGLTATRYHAGNNDYDVVLILAESDRNSLPALDRIFVNSPVTNSRIPLSNFASFNPGTGPMTISRENQSRIIHITSGVQRGTKLNVMEAKLRALIQAEIPADEDVLIEFAGDNSELLKLMLRFVLIVVIAIALVFGVMAALFESFRDPFIIVFNIPLALIGVVAIYAVTGDMFNILTAVGLLVLVGVIINNGIVLVDYTNLLRKRGLSLNEACVEAAGSRLRPILMTTLTTVLGLAPMAFTPGEGSEMVGPIGKTVLGGLMLGTLGTLFLMPTLYAIINKRSDQRAAKAAARRERIAAGLSGKQKAAAGTGSQNGGEV